MTQILLFKVEIMITSTFLEYINIDKNHKKYQNTLISNFNHFRKAKKKQKKNANFKPQKPIFSIFYEEDVIKTVK